MVENQHRKITGYRDLSEAEIALMNEIKAHEKATADLHRRVVAVIGPPADHDIYDEGVSRRRRQAAIARNEFEHAFMRLVRVIANPLTPWEG